MKYNFDFYKKTDFDDLVRMALASYQWSVPTAGLSRIEFAMGFHPEFTGNRNAWEHTTGVYRLNGKVVAAVWNEGAYDGNVFFMFDTRERADDLELLEDMIKFSKTYAAGLKEDQRTRTVSIFVPQWHDTLKNYLLDHGAEAFHELRKQKHYKEEFTLCVLDREKRPVAMTMIWYDPLMPYCEMEPLAVVWWERRKGIATALIHEAVNRVLEQYPQCQGITGGDQEFYRRMGFEKRGSSINYTWNAEIFISWKRESLEHDYEKEYILQ